MERLQRRQTTMGQQTHIPTTQLLHTVQNVNLSTTNELRWFFEGPSARVTVFAMACGPQDAARRDYNKEVSIRVDTVSRARNDHSLKN